VGTPQRPGPQARWWQGAGWKPPRCLRPWAQAPPATTSPTRERLVRMQWRFYCPPPPLLAVALALALSAQRALSVTQRALSVTQRALSVTQRALSVTQRALSVTQSHASSPSLTLVPRAATRCAPTGEAGPASGLSVLTTTGAAPAPWAACLAAPVLLASAGGNVAASGLDGGAGRAYLRPLNARLGQRQSTRGAREPSGYIALCWLNGLLMKLYAPRIRDGLKATAFPPPV
jgi:hypothetical protein